MMNRRFDWPADGICFDVENNGFWWPAWGPRPSELGEAKSRVRSEISRAPKLIPLFGHRFLPATPCEAGNPVFSINQTDIILYGQNLEMYFRAELDRTWHTSHKARKIAFWSDLLEWNGGAKVPVESAD